uniref:Uncharacterized protein n=1 Tax=Lotus japonicus TaxID=34305 RepID=I3T7C4_LOTJA|nr:unknown [Lotus japonicus]
MHQKLIDSSNLLSTTRSNQMNQKTIYINNFFTDAISYGTLIWPFFSFLYPFF